MSDSLEVNDSEIPVVPAPLNTSSRGTKILGQLTLVFAVLLVLYAFVVTKPDTDLRESIRILYIHVPSVSMAYTAMLINAGASIYYLAKKSEFADLLAEAAAEIGVALLSITLISGMLWGRITWGAYWVWDARLTTTALLFLMYVGYLTMRNIPAAPRTRGTRSAIVGIISAVMIYPVHMSVEWWSSLHQSRTVFAKLDSDISGSQETALYIGFVTFMLFMAWIMMHRFRVGWLAERAAETEVEHAIAQRKATATVDAEVTK